MFYTCLSSAILAKFVFIFLPISDLQIPSFIFLAFIRWSFLTNDIKHFFDFFLIQILSIYIGIFFKKDALKLSEIYFAIFLCIMELDDLFNLLVGDALSTLPVKGLSQIRCRNKVCIVDIKLFEQTPKLLFVQNLLNRNRCCDKLRIVYHAIAIIVYLLNYTLNLVVIEL